MAAEDISDSFLPLVSTNLKHPPKVIILGSSPGVVSLKQQRYYAHPRNSFWWIMSQLLSFNVHSDYEHRVNAITEAGIFLWDVLKRCERQGSLDANILRQSEQVNDLEAVLTEFQTISMICFNGKAAYSIFKRHFSILNFQHIECHVLPSTSPAHASMSREDKLRHWQVIGEYLENG